MEPLPPPRWNVGGVPSCTGDQSLCEFLSTVVAKVSSPPPHPGGELFNWQHFYVVSRLTAIWAECVLYGFDVHLSSGLNRLPQVSAETEVILKSCVVLSASAQ